MYVYKQLQQHFPLILIRALAVDNRNHGDNRIHRRNIDYSQKTVESVVLTGSPPEQTPQPTLKLKDGQLIGNRLRYVDLRLALNTL